MEGNTESSQISQKSLRSEALPSPTTKLSWVDRFKERLRNVISVSKTSKQEENLQEHPEISIDIFFTPHMSASDVNRLKKRFNEADIYIPESAEYHESDLEEVREISNGKLRPETAFEANPYSEHRKEIMKMLYNSKKPVTFIDPPLGNPLNDKFHKAIPNPRNFIMFSEYLNATKAYMGQLAEAVKEKEEYMLVQLPIKIEELLEQYPYLRQKKPIRVLLSLGAGHSGIYGTLQKQGELVSRQFSHMPFIFGVEEEAIRRYLFNKEVDAKLVASVFLRSKLDASGLCSGLTRDYVKRELLNRRIVSQFDFQDAEEIFNRLKQNEQVENIFKDKLNKKGITLPSSREELDEFLARPTPKTNNT